MSPGPVRLLTRPPGVFVGPEAAPAREGRWGVLLGTRRAQWVDVVQFETWCGSDWPELAARRIACFRPRDADGLSGPFAAFDAARATLLRELVPGDVVATENGFEVHLGDAFRRAPLVR